MVELYGDPGSSFSTGLDRNRAASPVGLYSGTLASPLESDAFPSRLPPRNSCPRKVFNSKNSLSVVETYGLEVDALGVRRAGATPG